MTMREFCARKPFSPWFPVFVAIGVAVGAGSDVSMPAGVGFGVALGVAFSLWRLRK